MNDRTSINIRRGTLAQLHRIAERNRLTMFQAIAVVVNGWSLLTDEQRVQAIQMPDAPAPRRARDPVPS